MDLVAQAASLQVAHIKFTGGEPFTRPYTARTVQSALSQGIRVSVESNAMKIPRELIELDPDEARGLTIFASLDGSTDEIHDGLRGAPGALRRTLASLRTWRAAGHRLGIHTVVSRDNVDNILDIHHLAQGLGAAQHKLILSVHALGRGSDVANRSLTVPEVFELLRGLPSAEFWDYDWHPKDDGPTRLMTTLPPAFQPGASTLQTCGWGEDFMAVLANGDVSICHGLYDEPSLVAGNIREDELRAIWEGSQMLEGIRSWDNHDLHGICGNCQVAASCRGLCRASAFGAYGDLRAPYPFCQVAYETGSFPASMQRDPNADSRYRAEVVTAASSAAVAVGRRRRSIPVATSG